jgi:hypothetical protein
MLNSDLIFYLTKKATLLSRFFDYNKHSQKLIDTLINNMLAKADLLVYPIL